MFGLILKEDQDRFKVLHSTQPEITLRDQHRGKKKEQIGKGEKEEEICKKEEVMKEKDPTSQLAFGFENVMSTSCSETALKSDVGSSLGKVDTSLNPLAANPSRHRASLGPKKHQESNNTVFLKEWEAAEEREEYGVALHPIHQKQRP